MLVMLMVSVFLHVLMPALWFSYLVVYKEGPPSVNKVVVVNSCVTLEL